MKRICTYCKKEKVLETEFPKRKNGKDGYNSICRECKNLKQRIYRHTEKGKETNRQYEQSEKGRLYILKKREKYRLSQNISSYIRGSINDKNGTHWEELVDFTLEELKQHLESQFQAGMTWSNYGKWHIDHIRPITSFNIKSYEDEDFKKCWCLENLQPLWARDNISKGAKWNGNS